MDSIRHVDVDVNFLLVLYGLYHYRLVCLSVLENRSRPIGRHYFQ